MRLLAIIFFVLIFTTNSLHARILKVGNTEQYKTITAAANVALPGDSIICVDAVIQGGMFISNLQGNSNNWIYIIPAKNTEVIIRGGNNSIQFSNAAYIHIEGFIIEGQTGNGLNIDDGGSITTPAHHLRIISCTFRNINATGNNDLLKLSGLDDFEIKNCAFINGSLGGSGIDMVGCHRGKILENAFQNMGSNSIQAKGGTSDIEIFRNTFINGGARTMNLGGSTGLAFFRPQNATAEAERIKVIANVIQGSEAAIAFVGCRQVEVSNNTILFPRKWVMRILQETVDPNRFLPCGDNRFFNNITIIDQNVSIEVNIGSNTAPQTFSFDNNLWWKSSQPTWNGPVLPGQVSSNILADPLIIQNTQYKISSSSPAIAQGRTYVETVLDIEGKPFKILPSLGAFEGDIAVSSSEIFSPKNFNFYPNPVHDILNINFTNSTKRLLIIRDMNGISLHQLPTEEIQNKIDLSATIPGIYLLTIIEGNQLMENTIILKK